MGHFNPALPLGVDEIKGWGLVFRESFKETLFFEDPVKRGFWHKNPCKMPFFLIILKKPGKRFSE